MNASRFEGDIKVSQPHPRLQKGGADDGCALPSGIYVASVGTVVATHRKRQSGLI